MEELRKARNILITKPEMGRDNSRDLGVDVIATYSTVGFRKRSVRVWIGLVWLRAVLLGCCEHRCSIEVGKILGQLSYYQLVKWGYSTVYKWACIVK
jgi:hypothetical protein